MKVKTLLTVALISIGVMAFAEAPSPESRAAAERLLNVLKMDENFDSSMRQAINMSTGMFDQMDLSEEEKNVAREAMESSLEITMKKFSWANMKEMFIDIYAEVFTVEELNGIIEFYESPAGQKFVEKQPQLTQVTMQKMQVVMAEIMPEIQKNAEELAAKAKTCEVTKACEKTE